MVHWTKRIFRLSDFKKGYKLLDSFTIPNANVKFRIRFYISIQALSYWYTKKYKDLDFDKKFAINEFSRLYLDKFKSPLLKALKKLISYYKGFPSPIKLTEVLSFYFNKLDIAIASTNNSSDFKTMYIKFNVDCLQKSESSITQTIKHELLHMISEFYQHQGKIIKLINKWQDALKKSIDNNKKIVNKSFEKLTVHLNTYDLKQHTKEIDDLIKEFYYKSTEKFWNFISDSALCVIAIELDDVNYIQAGTEEDMGKIEELISKLSIINKISKDVRNKKNETERNLLLAVLKLFQFMSCLIYMPFRTIAVSVLAHSHNWKVHHPYFKLKNVDQRLGITRNIKDFKAIVKKYCIDDVAKGFLKFYDDYLNIIKAQAIHNDPLNPDITQQIHNTECLKRGKEAYETLNREFYTLFQKLKKYE